MPGSKILLGVSFVFSAIKTILRSVKAFFFSKDENIISDVLRAYLGPLSPIEKQGINSIEIVRQSMLQNNAEMPKIDFGKGSNFLSNSGTMERVRIVCRTMSKTKSECLFLFSLIKTLKPIHAIELGTCLGISSSYIGTALSQNQLGGLVTFEGSPARAKIAEENLENLDLGNYVKVMPGRFQDILGNYLQDIDYIDFAFIDGHHDGDATIGYFQQLIPKFSKGSIMVFDDIYWSAGMNRSWKTIKKSEFVDDSFVFKGMGVVLVG